MQIMKLLIIQFCPSYFHAIPRKSKYSYIAFSDSLNRCSSLNMKHQVSHPCKTSITL
jgi:hypothetical protein